MRRRRIQGNNYSGTRYLFRQEAKSSAPVPARDADGNPPSPRQIRAALGVVERFVQPRLTEAHPDGYQVQHLAPADFPPLCLHQGKTGWRAYWHNTWTGYNGSNRGQGQTLNEEVRAVRSDMDGKPLGSFPTPEAALRALVECYRQWGFCPA